MQLYSKSCYCVPIIGIPVPEVSISSNRTGHLYAGTGLTLTCAATLHPNEDNGEEVRAEWKSTMNISGERHTVSYMTIAGGNESRLVISPLRVQDTGLYFCIAKVTGGSQIATAKDVITVTVLCKSPKHTL